MSRDPTDVRMRFLVRSATGEVLSDHTVNFWESEQAGEEQGEVALKELAAGRAVELLVIDPDEDDRVVMKSVWVP